MMAKDYKPFLSFFIAGLVTLHGLADDSHCNSNQLLRKKLTKKSSDAIEHYAKFTKQLEGCVLEKVKLLSKLTSPIEPFYSLAVHCSYANAFLYNACINMQMLTPIMYLMGQTKHICTV